MMNLLSRAALTASAVKLTGLAAINAEASIVATRLTTPIVVDNSSVNIDIDNDGNTDVALLHSTSISTTDNQVDGVALVLASVGVAGDPASGAAFTLPFAAGTVIDASASYKVGNFLAFNSGGPRTGNTGYWANGGADPSTWPGPNQAFRGYVGFEFTGGDAAAHFAWMDLATKAYDPADLTSYDITVYGYGYETTPNTGIPAGVPEPASLALVALGAAGLLAFKRKPLPAAA